MKGLGKIFTGMMLGAVLFTGCGGKTDGGKTASGELKWPTKDVTVTLPYNAGGDTDLYCRLMSKKLADKFGENFVVVNMTGGSGIVAAKTIMAAKPDGYNILFNHTGASLVQEATKAADFSYTDDFTNVATVAQDNTYVVICKKDKWNNLQDMINEAKSNPETIRYSLAFGGITHYICSMMEKSMGIQLNKLDVGTGAAERLAAFIGDQVDLLAVNYMNIKDYVEKGDFIILGVCSEERNPGMEQFPTFKEQGYEVTSSKNYEVKFPKGADPRIVEKLSIALKEVTEDAEFKEELAKYYAVPYYRDAETTNKEDRAEVERLKEYFK